ncbi:MAG TPA: PIG-L family deacetylase [Stellaceae bacterium]|nr:PIG-L family deacetylase [Stellaceae bacterium]
MSALLTMLAGDGPILPRVMIVVAHPDDETIGLGAQLCRLRDVLLLHLTDGAPRDGADVRRAGFADPADYAAARRRELTAALAAGDAAGMRIASFGVPDREAFCDLSGLSRRLVARIAQERPTAVLTHAYEGGHPDHDAAAFAVHAACRLVRSSAAPREREARPEQAVPPPAIIEMPFYHAGNGGMEFGRFLPADSKEIVLRLDAAARRRKRFMRDRFATQRDVLAGFPLDAERFRAAPAHDFRRPPHDGPLLYEAWGWGITGDDWRRRATATLVGFGLD